MMRAVFTLGGVVILVAAVRAFFTTRPGEKIGAFLPAPFWIYFLPAVLTAVGVLPHSSPVYDSISRHALPAALILMLIGTPVTELKKLGPKATLAMALATVSMFLAMIAGFLLFKRWLPEGSWRAVGALLGTWIGGSANMLAVKEILQMPDADLAPLVITDTVLSYGWLALLLLGAGLQSKFDAGIPAADLHLGGGGSSFAAGNEAPGPWAARLGRLAVLLIFGFVFAEATVIAGKLLSSKLPLLSASGWTLLLASTLAVLLALTSLSALERWKASSIGTFLLYMVLVTIGAKATFQAALDAPIFLIYGLAAFLWHGAALLAAGRLLRVPLFLLTTASQANIGGPVSAPIVAGVYRPGTAYIGVLMAIVGALLGTYLGMAGGWICRALGGN